jgi:PEP-CTERM motif.
MKSLIGASVGAALLLAASVTPGHATSITLTGTGTGGRKASVTFDNVVVSGNHYLQVTLANTGHYNASKPIDILTGVYFNIQGSNPTLTRFSATLAPGSTVKDIDPDPTNLGGEWAYKAGLSVGGFTRGISSSGLGLFGPGDRFPGPNLQGPNDPDGIQYGITTLNDPDDTGSGNDNGGLLGNQMARNSVVFLLGGIGAGFDPSAAIFEVRFQYGTSLTEPSFESDYRGSSTRVPQPSSLALLAFGALGAVLVASRRAVLSVVRSR